MENGRLTESLQFDQRIKEYQKSHGINTEEEPKIEKKIEIIENKKENLKHEVIIEETIEEKKLTKKQKKNQKKKLNKKKKKQQMEKEKNNHNDENSEKSESVNVELVKKEESTEMNTNVTTSTVPIEKNNTPNNMKSSAIHHQPSIMET